jgi:hypothetical protein
MNLLPAYCSYSFFEALAGQSNIDLLDFENLADSKNRIEISQLVFKGLDVSIDLDAEKINELLEKPESSNQYIRFLIRNGRLRPKKDVFIKIRNNESNFVNDIICFSQFFVSNDYDGITNELEGSTGHLFNSINKSETYQRLSSFQVEPFKKGESKNWSFIKNYNVPHHSILIADPYLLENTTSLAELVKEFAPIKLKLKYNITLVTQNKKKLQSNDIIDKLKIQLNKTLKIDFNIELLIYSGEDFHDRYIITNNFMIYSGYGFGIIDNRQKSKKQSSWIVMNHAKIQDSKIPGNEKPHYVTVMNFIEQIKNWITRKEIGSSVVFNNPILI